MYARGALAVVALFAAALTLSRGWTQSVPQQETAPADEVLDALNRLADA